MGRRVWLLAAVVLFALGAAFMLYGQDDTEAEAPEVKVELPRRLRPAERERLSGRRTLPEAPHAGQPEAPARPRDPVLAALPQGRGKTAVVLEANALRHSPVGELLLACLDRRGGRGLERLRQETGINPLEDLDRVVVTPDGLMVSGHFEQARWDALFREGRRDAYGDKGRIYEQPARRVPLADGGTRERRGGVMGVWDNQLVVFGETDAEVKQALDRLEGRAPANDPAITEDQTYGEIYGVLSTEDMLRLVPADRKELAEQLAQAGARMELHVDAQSDVGLVARVTGNDPARLEDLGKTLGGALAAGRIAAQSKGEERLASLMELARVQPRGDSFNLEMALPLSYLQEQLSNCGAEPEGDGAPQGEGPVPGNESQRATSGE